MPSAYHFLWYHRGITNDAHDEVQTMSRSVRILAIGTVLGIILYWSAVLVGIFPVEPLVPGYVDWFMSFPIADSWIALCLVSSLLLQRNNPLLSAVSLSAAGSGLIFLGLYAFAYGFRTGLVFQLTVNEVSEIVVKIYCLSAGVLFLYDSTSFQKRLPRPIPSGGKAALRL